MKKKLLGIVIGIFALLFVYFFVEISTYLIRQSENKKMVQYCSQNNSEECFTRMFELMLPKILINRVWIDGFETDLIKLDHTSRVDSAVALAKASNLIGYGVLDDVQYEVEYARLFNHYSYAFDCGVDSNFNTGDRLCKFSSECIASDDFLIMNQVSSGNVHTFEQKLKELNLWDKKVFVKMDVAEADIIALPELIKNSDKLTGFNIGLHIRTPKAIIEKIKLLDEINKKFVLVSRNPLYVDDNFESEIVKSKYYDGISKDGIMYLSYVNKDLVDSYKISWQQDTDKYYRDKKVSRLVYTEQVPNNDVSWVITFIEKVKAFFRFGKDKQ